MSFINFLIRLLAYLAVLKIVLHIYLDVSGGSYDLISAFNPHNLRFTRFYKEEETGWRNVLKIICNVSFFFVVFLFCMIILGELLLLLIHAKTQGNNH